VPIGANQLPERFRHEIEDQLAIYRGGRTFEQRREIPDTRAIPLLDPKHWLRIPSVICVYVDMQGSTKLSASAHEKSTAGAYQLFTGTAVALFDSFEAPYIDVKGDGVFALFNPSQAYRALAAAVTFKTFSEVEFVPTIKGDTGLSVGCHIGIDQKLVLVRKLGLKRYSDRTDRQNEVWAGKPVNMASKLAGKTDDRDLLVSDRFYASIPDERARMSCGCVGGVPTSQKQELWEAIDLRNDPLFDFATAYKLKTQWCRNHGSQFCEAILRLDTSH
jgi:class 3 adenylate cyclase